MGAIFATLPEIAKELRVSQKTLRESGVLEACRKVPSGTLSRWDLYLWSDVVRAAVALGDPGPTRSKSAPTLPVHAFESLQR